MSSELLLPALYCKVVTLSYLLRDVFSDEDFSAIKLEERVACIKDILSFLGLLLILGYSIVKSCG